MIDRRKCRRNPPEGTNQLWPSQWVLCIRTVNHGGSHQSQSREWDDGDKRSRPRPIAGTDSKVSPDASPQTGSAQ